MTDVPNQIPPPNPLAAALPEPPSSPLPLPRLKARSDLHLKRKIWHAAGVAGMAAFFNFAGLGWSWAVLIAAAVLIVPLDFLRQRRPKLNDFTMRIFEPVMRAHEARGISGMTFLFAGTAFLLLLFDKHVVTLTLIFLAFGDPVASFCGIQYGRDRILGRKTLQGTAGAFFVCAVAAAIYFYSQNLMIERLWVVAPLAGFIGAAAELIPIGELDDNFTFPAIAGSLLWVLFRIFGA